MSDWILQSEGLGKCYQLRHSRLRHTALRDVLGEQLKKLFLRRPKSTEKSAPESQAAADFWALRDVSFSVKTGEVVGIVGRNGAGKSTLLKLLSRITEPTEGSITIRGRVASLLEVGTGFHPELTGRENIFLNGAILGMTRAEIRRKFDEIVAFAEVSKFLDTPVKRYSSGMYVRLAFAVAAHLEPEILVVDEVLAVGDAEFQRKCLGKMREVAGHGRTVLFVSHNLEAVDRLTSRCIHLQSGRVLEDGPTPTVVANYLRRSPAETLDPAQFRTASIPGTVSLKRIWSESMDGTRCAAFRQGEPFRVVLEVEAETGAPCDYAIVLENGRQNPLYTTHLSDLAKPISSTGTRRLAAEFQQPMLRRGSYGVSVAIFSPDKQSFYDVVLHCPLLEVAGSLHGDFPEDNRWGDIYVGVGWKVE